MRKYEYRGYNGTKWIYSTEISGIPCFDEVHYFMPNEENELNQEYIGNWDSVSYVGQYTGLKDANGTKIYEGDIIPHHFNKNIKGVVKFGEYKSPCDDKFTKHQGFYIDFYGESKDYYRKDLGYWATVSKVIGNVYENPELLEDR